MESPNVIKVEALRDYRLLLTFDNKEIKIFDMVPYLRYPIFKALKDESEFHKFSIVDGTIEWDCGSELSNDTFYINSINAESQLIEM